MKIDFYKEKLDDIDISISLSLEDGVLKFEGFDYGEKVGEIRGVSDEYEYSLMLNGENTEKLFKLMGISNKTEKEKLEFIRDKFSEDHGFSGFKKYCEENGIETEFFCWP